MRHIEYYCGPEFDPRCGQEMSVPEWLLKKIRHAKATKIIVDSTFPLDGIRSNRIADAIDQWKKQYHEIFFESEEVL